MEDDNDYVSSDNEAPLSIDENQPKEDTDSISPEKIKPEVPALPDIVDFKGMFIQEIPTTLAPLYNWIQFYRSQ